MKILVISVVRATLGLKLELHTGFSITQSLKLNITKPDRLRPVFHFTSFNINI
jgi:hypothetical protein